MNKPTWLSLALLAGCVAGQEDDECTDRKVGVYQVVVAFELASDPNDWAQVEACYLPANSDERICARGSNGFNFVLALDDPSLDGVLVVPSDPTMKEQSVTWRWSNATWLRDGDRYSLKITRGGETLLDRTEPAKYGDLDPTDDDLEATDNACYEPTVATVNLRPL